MIFILSVVLAVLLLGLADVIFIGIIIGTMWISSKRLKVKQSPEKVNYLLGHHGLLLLLRMTGAYVLALWPIYHLSQWIFTLQNPNNESLFTSIVVLLFILLGLIKIPQAQKMITNGIFK